MIHLLQCNNRAYAEFKLGMFQLASYFMESINLIHIIKVRKKLEKGLKQTLYVSQPTTSDHLSFLFCFNTQPCQWWMTVL